MTFEQIRNIDTDFLLATDIAPILGVDPQSIRVAAKQYPERLGFAVCVIGTRVLIPRLAFVRWMEGGKMDVGTDGH